MKDAEEATRAVLAGLRDVEAPAGMERRVLLAVERRAAEGQRAWGWRRMALASGAVLAFGLAVAVLAVHRHEEPVARARLDVVPAAAPGAEMAPGRADSAPARTVRVPGVRRTAVRQADAMLAMDALALREMRAPSQVSPPLPLTEQERLLLRVAHRGDPAELAMLDPEVRLKQEMEAKVEFQQFFEPATATTITKENR